MTLDRSPWNFRQNKSGAPYLARTGPAESIARKPGQTFLKAAVRPMRAIRHRAPAGRSYDGQVYQQQQPGYYQ
jgi:hypothetical protein